MGVVYVATQLDLDRPVALKLMRPEVMGFTGGAERFVREARVASRLTSEHVARVLEVGTTEAGVPFFAMELLRGRALDEELQQRGPLPIAEAVDIVLEACEALAEAHAMGLVHRDIKPENLFLVRHKSGRQSVRVLDFGLTKLAASDASISQSASAFGTPQYMSPEQTRSAKYVDHPHRPTRDRARPVRAPDRAACVRSGDRDRRHRRHRHQAGPAREIPPARGPAGARRGDRPSAREAGRRTVLVARRLRARDRALRQSRARTGSRPRSKLSSPR